jgi:hypothetical protein
MAKEPNDMNRGELVAEVRKLRHILQTTLEHGSEMWMESGVNTEGEPFVRLSWGNEMGQLSPARTREHAVGLLETAAAAEFDAALWKVVTEDMGLEPQAAMVFLSQMREKRGMADYQSGRTQVEPRPDEGGPAKPDEKSL